MVDMTGTRPGRPPTVPQLLAARAAAEPGRVALESHGGGALTYGDWHARAGRAVAGLLDRGVGRGDRVGLLYPDGDWLDFAVAYCATVGAGAVAVPCPARLGTGKVSDILARCRAVGVIRSAFLAAPPAIHGGWTATLDELDRAGSDGAAVDVRPGDIAQILFTSGTTGRPKGVAASHANLTHHLATDPRRRPLRHSRYALHAFPIGSNAGQSMLINALVAWPTTVALHRFTPRRFARAIQQFGVGSVFAVPAMAIELVDSAVLETCDTSGVMLFGSTASALPPAVAVALQKAFPNAVVVNYYTTTEAAPAQTVMLFDPARPDSVGRTVAGQVMVADRHGAPLPPGSTGDVWLHNPFPRHYVDDDATGPEVFRDGWVRTGDLGHVDGDGFLTLVDRETDIIKSGAFKVSTLEVEAALYEHPDVAQAAVLGLPHPVLGRAVAAAVVPRRGVPPGRPGLAEVRAFLSDRLAEYELPARVVLVRRLPRNAAGKVRKDELRAWMAAEHRPDPDTTSGR